MPRNPQLSFLLIKGKALGLQEERERREVFCWLSSSFRKYLLFVFFFFFLSCIFKLGWKSQDGLSVPLSLFPSVWKDFWKIPCVQEKIPIAFGYVFPFSSVQWLRRVQLFVTPWTAASQASLSITNSQSLLKLMSIKSVMPSNHFILCCPLLLPPSVFPSIRVFSSESVLHIRWPKCWSFSFSISPYNEYSVLISFRMDWLDLLQSKGLSRVFSNTTVQKHQFFGTQLSL